MTAGNKIHVLVVEDHPLTRVGLVFAIQTVPDLELVGQAQTGEEALELCAATRPDVILMDLKLPGIDGVETTRLLRERFPLLKIIGFTSYVEGDIVERMLQAGAIGFLVKDATVSEVTEAIRAAHSGRGILSHEAAIALIDTVQKHTAAAPGLTEREREVLELLAQGLSTDMIAAHLLITPATVKFHITHILSKLGVSTRSEAIVVAWQQRLVRLPEESSKRMEPN